MLSKYMHLRYGKIFVSIISVVKWKFSTVEEVYLE